jgi:hypothetical protein
MRSLSQICRSPDGAHASVHHDPEGFDYVSTVCLAQRHRAAAQAVKPSRHDEHDDGLVHSHDWAKSGS